VNPPAAGGAWRSIRVRIAAAFLAAMVAMGGSIGFLVQQYAGVSASQALITDGYLPLARVVDRVKRDQQRVDTDVQRLLGDLPRPGTGPQSNAAIYASALKQNLQEVRERAAAAAALARGGEERAAINRITALLDRIEARATPYSERAGRVVGLAEANRRDEATGEAQALVSEGKALAAEIDGLARQIDRRITTTTIETEARRVRANLVTLAIAVGASAFSLTLLAAVLYALAPIGRLTAEVRRLAGDAPAAAPAGDEIALLAAEFDRMVRAIGQRDRRLVERAEELNRVSRYLASVVDTLEEGLVVVEDGAVTLANPAAARMFGVATGQVPPPELTAAGAQELSRDGRTLAIRNTPFAPGGKTAPTGWIAVCADVTEQREAQDRLARSERLALIGQMLAQVTHEVRNPLNALSLNAELLADELSALDPDRATEAWAVLATIGGEIERLTHVTAHYLQLARRPRVDPTPEDPALIVREVARLVEPGLGKDDVTLRTRADTLPRQWLDGNQVRQALLNLVRNAHEARATSIAIEVRRSGDEVVFTVQDDGEGMGPEQVERASEPFWTTRAQGTGLGLAIVRQILEAHGGRVALESAPGRGTTVALSFPWRTVDDRPAIPAPTEES
jgi:signal transduction histidine kinase